MKINLQKIVPNFTCSEDIDTLKYFKQFNVYETINCNKEICKNINYKNYSYKTACPSERFYRMHKIEYTCPKLNVISTKIVNTIEGTSLEGQNLTGKKLIIIGDVKLSLIIMYSDECNNCNKFIREVTIPFSTFIIIPKCLCTNEINLKYLIEDVSIARLCSDKILVSITLLMQYIDEC